jgi:hypothetical protein
MAKDYSKDARIIAAAMVVGQIAPTHFSSLAAKNKLANKMNHITVKAQAKALRTLMEQETAKVVSNFENYADKYYSARLNKRAVEQGLAVPAYDINWTDVVGRSAYAQEFELLSTDVADVKLAKTVAKDISTEFLQYHNNLPKRKLIA